MKSVTTIVLFTHLGFVLFTSGCQKNSPGPVPEIALSQPDSQSENAFTDASVNLTADVGWASFEPELLVTLSGHEKHLGQIVAYRDLRIARATTNTGPLRLANILQMKEMTYARSIVNQTGFIDHENTQAPSISLTFQTTSEGVKVLRRLQGSITAIAAGKSTEHVIPNLQNFLKRKSERMDWTKIFKSHHLPPPFAGGSDSIALTFNEDVIITKASIINENQKKYAQTWTSHESLPDGRSVLQFNTAESTLPESLGVKFTVHAELVEHQLSFDFNDLEIPTFQAEGVTSSKTYSNSVANGAKAAKGLTVQAHADWSQIPIEFPKEGEKPKFPLEIHVDLFGANAVNTVAVGKLHVEAISAHDEPLHEIQNQSPYSVSSTTDFKYYDPFELLSRPPVDGAQATFQFDSASKSVTELTKFTGSVSRLTAKSHEYILVDNLIAALGKTVHHPLLEAMQIQLKPVLYGDGLSVSVDHDHAFEISEIIAVDTSGSTSQSIYSSRLQSGRGTMFSFHAQDKLPETLPVRIRVNRELEEQLTRFEFENMRVPQMSEFPSPVDPEL